MYDDRYDGKIDEAFFQKKLKEYKDREFAIIQEMESHAKADENFHVTANMVLSLARRSREIFESSEVDEKRQLLNFVFQNLQLKDKKLSATLREPFKIIKDTSLLEKCPGMCASQDSNLKPSASEADTLSIELQAHSIEYVPFFYFVFTIQAENFSKKNKKPGK
jgi:hypothetical protein